MKRQRLAALFALKSRASRLCRSGVNVVADVSPSELGQDCGDHAA